MLEKDPPSSLFCAAISFSRPSVRVSALWTVSNSEWVSILQSGPLCLTVHFTPGLPMCHLQKRRLLSSGGLAWTFPMVHAAHCALRLPWIYLAIMLLPAKGVVMWFPATILVESCRRAHLGVQVEMVNNLTNHSHTHPADLLVPNWVLGKPTAFDLSATSPLNPTTLLEASVTTDVAALTTELRKHSSNDTKCKELDWLASQLATCSSKAKSVVLTELYGRLNLHLVRANAIAILARSLGQSDVGLSDQLASRLNQPKSITTNQMYGRLNLNLVRAVSRAILSRSCMADTVLDPLGHHASTCKRGGDAVFRHNRLRDVAELCRLAHLCVKVEAGNNLTPDHSHTRPADVLVQNWSSGRPAAFDICVFSPLNTLTLSEAGVCAGAAAQAGEVRKHSANDDKCGDLGWFCVPLVTETYGAWGPEAKACFSQLASRLSIRLQKPKSVILFMNYMVA
ncbi:hypothetical protein EMCRGX_G026533 [Ephydatia muelleri]